MVSVYTLDGFDHINDIGLVAAEISAVEGVQLVKYDTQSKELTLGYVADLVDKIIVEVMNLIRKIAPKAQMKNK